MGHRSIVLLISAMFALVATNVSALGLGKIKLESALNQPLKAEIELFEVRELTIEEIKVAIASREDFDRIGVDKIYFLSDLKFEVVLDGRPHIKVNSTKIVREPFLNFVVQVQWPSGKLLREYTLLMDLPVFSEESAPIVQSTTSPSSQPSAAQPTTDYNPRSVFDQAPPRPSVSQVQPTYTDDTYRVRANDTLWEIAVAVRPDGSVSIHQTMLAIQRENPEAFINNNINLLKSGQILRIPDGQDMSAMSRREAVREVAVQNAAWSGGEVSDAQLSATNVYDDTDTSSSAREGRVKLTSPDDSYDSAEGRASGGLADSSTDALENELAITMEQLDQSGRENQELQSKVASLEEQIETMERMLEVSNENLRALELAAQKNAEDARQAAIDEVADDLADTSDPGAIDDETLISDVTEDDTALESDDAYDSEADLGADDALTGELDTQEETAEEVVEATPEPTATPASDPRKVVISQPEPEKGIIDIILENVLYIAAGVIALAVGAFFLLRQKSSDEEDFDDFMQQHGLKETESAEVEDTPAEDDIDLGDFSDDIDDSPLEDVPEEEEVQAESEAQTEDVVAEADIYIAYGKFDQAEEMLLKSLAKEPGDQDVRLKLLEVYSSQGDAESFDPHFAKLRAFASPNILERAENLRAGIPNVAEFDEGSFDTSDVSKFGDDEDTVLAGDSSLDFDMGDTGTEEADLSMDLDLGDLDSDGDPDSGFELDLPDENEDDLSLDLSSVETDSDQADDSLDLDFDLDLPEGESSESFDLDLDLPSETETSAEEDAGELDLSTGLDFDLEGSTGDEISDLKIDIEEKPEEVEEPDDGVDFDMGDLDLDLDGAGADSDSLDADLASLDADLDLGLDDDDDTVLREKPVELEDAGSSFDLEAELGSLDEGDLDLGDSASVSSDTVVNEALNDEYIEQKLSEDSDDLNLDDALPLEDDADLNQTQSLDALNIEEEGDLDLSSLDQELDALTSDLDDTDLGVADIEDDAETPAMDEPVTDFDDFEDDLEKDEAMAETVKSEHTSDSDVENMGEDTMFDQAINEVPKAESNDMEFELPEVDPEDVGDDDLDFLSDSDETATKLDLARAYIDMGDQEGARDIIREVMGEGNDQQKAEAESLLARIDS